MNAEHTFDTFYASYPRKAKPRDARKAWGQTLKRGVKPIQIMLSLQFMMETEWKDREKQHIPYPASFLRGEEFDLERVEALEDEEETPLRWGHHVCMVCKPAHEWDETGDSINWRVNGEYVCPKQISAMRAAIAGGGVR